jgi:pyridoxine 4-dehydrogenase
LKIGILAYSPLGRGILTNTVNPSNLPEGDWRHNAPMFSSENFKEN